MTQCARARGDLLDRAPFVARIIGSFRAASNARLAAAAPPGAHPLEPALLLLLAVGVFALSAEERALLAKSLFRHIYLRWHFCILGGFSWPNGYAFR